jgi:hypothetical protein
MIRMTMSITVAVSLVAAGVTSAAEVVPHEGEAGGCGELYNYRSGSGGEYSFGHAGGGWAGAEGWSLDGVYLNRSNSNEGGLYAGLAQNYSMHAYCDN